MNRRVFLMSAAGLSGCGFDRRPRLNVFNWSAYIAPDTVPKFEAEFGVRVRYGIYESNEEMLARVMSGNSGWDVVFPTDYIVKPMLVNGLLAPIDHALLRNLGQLEERFQRPDWDPKQSAVSRRKFFASVAGTDMLILPIHYPAPTVGLITADSNGFDYKYKRD